MIGDSPVSINTDDRFTIKGTAFGGTEGLWELLTRKNVNTMATASEKKKGKPTPGAKLF